MQQMQDSFYARRPWSSSAEQQVTNLLREWVDLPSSDIHALKPPIPNIGRVPPRRGYAQHVIGIDDIVRLDDLYPGARVDYSQRQSGYSSTEYPAMGVI